MRLLLLKKIYSSLFFFTYIMEHILIGGHIMIVRGTTPSFTFLLPEFDVSIDHGLVSFTQDKVVEIHKEFTDEDVDYTDDGLTVTVSLNQEETLRFHYFERPEYDCIKVQLKVYTEDGSIYGSRIVKESVGRALYEGIL